MEAEVGINCVGVPIIAPDGGVLGALSLSGPAPRITAERQVELAQKLKVSVQEIENKL